MNIIFSYIRKIWVFALLFLISACSSYKKHIMFQTESGNYPKDIEYSKMLAERNYRIQVNDQLDIRVYTNEGERIIDPDYVLQEEIRSTNIQREEAYYFVEKDGMVKIPMVGPVKLADLTTREAELLLEKEFSGFYKEPYVVVKFKNKRIVVLGKPGGQVINLENEDMTLIEVLALAGGLEQDSKAQNIRLIRGDLKDPEVQIIDLSTIEGMMKADLKVYSGDIIYIEPVVRGFSEGTRDFFPIISVLASLVAIIVAIQALSTN
jgi:polysaccharide export outer membrane protein